MKTDRFIDLIAQDAAVKWPLRYVLWQAVAVAVVVASAAFLLVIGPRPDIVAAAQTGRFLFKFVVTGSLAIVAGRLFFVIGQPGTPVRSLGWCFLIPIGLLVTAVGAELVLMPPATWEARMIGHNARMCLSIIPALSLPPLVCFLLALRKGAPTHPAIAGMVAGAAAAGIAASLYAANCDDDSPLFVMLWYPVAIACVCTAGALIGGRVLRW